MEPMDNTCLNERGAAAFLGLSRQTLANWRHCRKGPKYSKPGGYRVIYRLRDLEEFLTKHQVDPEVRDGDRP